jgi:hypothetical protein
MCEREAEILYVLRRTVSNGPRPDSPPPFTGCPSPACGEAVSLFMAALHPACGSKATPGPRQERPSALKDAHLSPPGSGLFTITSPLSYPLCPLSRPHAFPPAVECTSTPSAARLLKAIVRIPPDPSPRPFPRPRLAAYALDDERETNLASAALASVIHDHTGHRIAAVSNLDGCHSEQSNRPGRLGWRRGPAIEAARKISASARLPRTHRLTRRPYVGNQPADSRLLDDGWPSGERPGRRQDSDEVANQKAQG